MWTEVASAVAAFVVPGVGEVVVVALCTVGKLVREMKENEQMCKRVYKRMKSVHEELLKLKDGKVLRERNVLEIYGDNIASFIAFLKKQADKGFIRRLTSNRKVVEEIQEFHIRMDSLFKVLNLSHIAEMSKWRQEWQEDKEVAMQERADILANNQTMKVEIERMGNNIKEGMALIVVALQRSQGESRPEVELLTKAFKKVISVQSTGAGNTPVVYWERRREL
ncbi:Serine/threonine protein kinase [Phytophthora cinnamomi]|uniref:Serine/threonine protein kinase n=2 Tax=Phytophthora cinnamomi TaxID=4785 RepID=UPI0035597ED5|nr:Serine/threonine protein kinase [Phytophthora cinnamomi]